MHIVRLLDAHTTPQAVCLVMELVEGATLWQHIVRVRKAAGGAPTEGAVPDVEREERQKLLFDEGKVQFCVRQLVSGLAYIHAKGIAYRDLKPTNILVARGDHSSDQLLLKNLTLKLLDFGFATADPENCDCPVGTLRCMAPEALNTQETVDLPDDDEEKIRYDGCAADVFSLGVLLYELASLGVPLLRGSLEDIEMDKRAYEKALGEALDMVYVLPGILF